jgi:hypothetical protein
MGNPRRAAEPQRACSILAGLRWPEMSTPPPPPPLGVESAGNGPISPTGQPLASAIVRVFARVIDVVIVYVIIGGIIYTSITGDAVSVGDADEVSTGKALLAAALVLAVGFLWDAVLTKVKGGSPMKLLFGLRVVRSDNGGPVEWTHAVVRWLVVAIWSLIPFPAISQLGMFVLVIVSMAFIFTKPLRQAVWDQVAKTLVVKAR